MTSNDLSLAEQKLARQLKRNEKAEATLGAPVAERQVSRGKKSWKPFDYTAEMPGNEGGGVALPTEARVSTFRPMTRESSLSRSMSSLSQRTAGTHHSEIERERQESSFAEGGGFQLITSRKHRGKLNTTAYDSQLSAWEAKPEEKQTTVEAVPDTKEIYNIFGNPPPPPAHLTGNPGSVNGQLQFIQHTNGDISAHQWDNDRYEWQNIGQFSNIRKRIEGQLASNRLKGETAHQTLQQNSLAYFRTVAKQKEADVMGLAFGQKEIHALMPELKTAQPGSTPKKSVTASEVPPPPPQDLTKVDANDAASLNAAAHSQIGASDQLYHYEGYPCYAANYGAYPVNHGQHFGYGGHPWYQLQSDGYNHVQSVAASSLHDPFYSGAQDSADTSVHRGSQSSTANRQPNSAYDSYAAIYGQHSASAMQKQVAMNYDYHFPPPGNAFSRPQQQQNHAQPSQESTGPDAGRKERNRGGLRGSAASYTFGEGFGSQASVPKCGHVPSQSQFLGVSATERHSVSTDGQRSKGTTPLSTSRTSMKDHLYKISDQAKERNLSQSNIRTVLYDLFRSSQASEQASSKQASPELKKTVANPSGLPPSLQTRSVPKLTFDAAVGSGKPATQDGEEEMRMDGKGHYWARRDTAATSNVFGPPGPCSKMTGTHPVLSSRAPTKPESIAGLNCAGTQKDNQQTVEKNHDGELRAWVLNGNTFARQEELYQRLIKASEPFPSARSSEPVSSPLSTQAPIGTPASAMSRNTTATRDSEGPLNAYKDSMTRLLIPVLENLASYVEGPREKRPSYFSPWVQAPAWAIDRSPDGNKSFYDGWGADEEPPARLGRDPRYRPMGAGLEAVRFGGFRSPQRVSGTGVGGLTVGSGSGMMDRRFGFGAGR